MPYPIKNSEFSRMTLSNNQMMFYDAGFDPSFCYSVTNKDEKFADIAMQEAKKSTLLSQHGCVAVYDGQIIAKGHNHHQCNSKDGFLQNTCSCHAEIDVLRKIYKLNIKKNKSKPRSPPRETANINSSFQAQLKRSCFKPKEHQLICGS